MAKRAKLKKKKRAKSKMKASARKMKAPARKKQTERKLEEGLEETFPASDPPAVTDPVLGEKA
jgi:hypothetical protein